MNNRKKILDIASTFALLFLVGGSFLAVRASDPLTLLRKQSKAILATVPDLSEDGIIFRDDFNGELRSGWTWQNEDASHWKIDKDGWLEIAGGDGSILAGRLQSNLVWLSLPKGDLEIRIHLKSQPLFDFQRAGLLLYEDSEHYISLSQGYCMHCVLGGSGIFLEYNLNGNRGRFSAFTNATDVYLMLVSEQGAVSAFYAIQADDWQHLASLGNDTRFKRVSLSVTNDNIWEEGYDLVGKFDYIEIRRAMQCGPTPVPVDYQQG